MIYFEFLFGSFKFGDIAGAHWHDSFPQMYMHALLGPAIVGRQMPLVHVTFDSMSGNDVIVAVEYSSGARFLNKTRFQNPDLS
jgi:hypothetical protein